MSIDLLPSHLEMRIQRQRAKPGIKNYLIRQFVGRVLAGIAIGLLLALVFAMMPIHVVWLV